MEQVHIFVSRMKRIGINVELWCNYPWIYLDRINGVKVTERYESNHGFTVFFSPIKPGKKAEMTSIPEVFKLIRKYVHGS